MILLWCNLWHASSCSPTTSFSCCASPHVLLPRITTTGDWAAVGELLASQGLGGYYDIILTAETIYNEESQYRLLACIKQVCM